MGIAKFRLTQLITALLSFVTLLGIGQTARASQNQSQVLAQFQNSALSIDKRLLSATSAASILAWQESYLEQAAIEMFEKTQNPEFFNFVVDRIERQVIPRFQLTRDVYRGRDFRGFRDAKGTHYLVQSSMIVYPMARLARLILENPELTFTYQSKARIFLRTAELALAEFQPEWIEGALGAGRGWYRFPSSTPDGLSNLWVPFNQAAIAGSVSIELISANKVLSVRNQVTSPKLSSAYQVRATQAGSRAQKLARFLAASLRHNRDGTMFWTYWPQVSANASLPTQTYLKAEDLSHAMLDIQFLHLSIQQDKSIFVESDLKGMALTFSNKVILPDNNLAVRVDGSSDSSRSQSMLRATCAGWILLENYDVELSNTCRTYIELGFDQNGLGAARVWTN